MNTYHHPPAAPFSFDIPIQPRERPAKRYRDEDEDDDADIHPGSGSYSPYPSYDPIPHLHNAAYAHGYDEDASGEDMPEDSMPDHGHGKSRPSPLLLWLSPPVSRTRSRPCRAPSASTITQLGFINSKSYSGCLLFLLFIVSRPLHSLSATAA